MSPDWRDLRKLAGDLFDDAQRLGAWALASSGPNLHEVTPYLGFGTTRRVLVHGRAMRARNIGPARENDNLIVNLINTYKRADSDADRLRPARSIRLGWRACDFDDFRRRVNVNVAL